MGKLFKHRGQAKIEWRPVFNSKAPNGKSCYLHPDQDCKAEGNQSWGGEIGNNVNNIANGVNSTERGAIAKLDKSLRAARKKRKQRCQVKVIEFESVAQEFPLTRLVATGDESALFRNLSPRTEKRIPVRSPASTLAIRMGRDEHGSAGKAPS